MDRETYELGQLKPGAEVVNDGNGISVDALKNRVSVLIVGEGNDGVGMEWATLMKGRKAWRRVSMEGLGELGSIRVCSK